MDWKEKPENFTFFLVIHLNIKPWKTGKRRWQITLTFHVWCAFNSYYSRQEKFWKDEECWSSALCSNTIPDMADHLDEDFGKYEFHLVPLDDISQPPWCHDNDDDMTSWYGAIIKTWQNTNFLQQMDWQERIASISSSKLSQMFPNVCLGYIYNLWVYTVNCIMRVSVWRRKLAPLITRIL